MRREARVWVGKTQRNWKNVARKDGSKEDRGRKNGRTVSAQALPILPL